VSFGEILDRERDGKRERAGVAGLGRREWRYGCGVVVGYLERERGVLEREVRKNRGERGKGRPS